MSLPVIDIFLKKLHEDIEEMEKAYGKKMSEMSQQHSILFEKVQNMYEKKGVGSIMRMMNRHDTVYVSPEDYRNLVKYHELRRAGIKLEDGMWQMTRVHRFQILPLKQMQKSLRNTCFEAIVTKPLTTRAAMRIKDFRDEREQIVREQEEQVTRAAARTAAMHAKQMKLQQVANAETHRIARAAEQQTMTKAQKRNMRRSQAKQTKLDG